MDSTDLARLNEIAARPAEDTTDLIYAPQSDARMRLVAQAIIKHSEEFNLDGENPNHSLSVDTYIASFLADVLVFADMLTPAHTDTSFEPPRVYEGGARSNLEHAISFISDSDVPTYDNLKGFQIR